MLSILVIDDEYLVRAGIRGTINWEDYGFQITGEAADGDEGLEIAEKVNPDIIITDIRMPKMDGLEFMAKVREANRKAKIIVLSGYDEFEYARSALKYGASAYLLKPIENQQLIETVLKVGWMIKQERETKEYYDNLELELPAIKKQFFLDLINGRINDEDSIQSKLEFLHMPVEEVNQVVIVVKVDDFALRAKEIPKTQGEKIGPKLTAGISRIFFREGGLTGVVVDKNVDETVIIIQDDKTGEDLIPALKGFCKELTAAVDRDGGVKFTVSIGISTTVNNLSLINEAYREASTAAGVKFLPGVHSITYIKDEGVYNCHKIVKDAVAYLKRHYNAEVTVETAAGDLFVSPSYLMHLFKEELGKTFVECLIEYRIEKAKELLREKKYKVYEVCEKVGYKDTKYFSQLFKKIAGMSPSEYIKMG